MTIHALVPQCAISVLSYSECKIAKYFMRLFPLGRAYRTLPLRHTSCTTVFLFATLVEKLTPPDIARHSTGAVMSTIF